ncbi:prolyl oligopeptidase family serine peptidase [Pseudonocardia nematodicida]|uniref:Prolyl oligopeptidase family serine peptidase n=1 Tax=Pseudonocardia nematodicida TaxID=1206997 RepID=A0ABV1KGY6_9PSEU
MRRSVPLILLPRFAGCGAPAPTAPGAVPDGIVGEWSGTIEVPGSPLDLGLTLTPDGGSLAVPAQGQGGIPVEDIVLDGDLLTFAVPALPGGARFAGTRSGERIAGTWTQGGHDLPLVLERGGLAGPARPQEPRPPFPYRAEDVTFDGDRITVAGTLTLPEGDGPFPAVVLITGSGAQDRDQTIAGHRMFLVLADALTRAGYAVLRTDDRGVGGTGGVLADADYRVLAADVVARTRFLRGRPEIDGDRIGLLGHSEGGYLAPLAADAAGAAFAILMAGAAVGGQEVLELQNRLLLEAAGAADQVEDQVAFVRRYGALVRAGDVDGARALARERVSEQQAGLPEEQRGDVEQLVAGIGPTPYFRSFLRHDPGPSLRALDVPVFAFFGDKDLQVPSAQSEPVMRELLAGNPAATVRTFPELNHLMQPAETGAVHEYPLIGTTIAPEVLDAVTAWLREHVPAP